MLIVDETGFLKKGAKSVGVKRQYSGTAGRVENCQIGVFPAYRGPRGHALIDRALYLPQDWAADPPRQAEAKVPDAIRFATKPALAREMLARSLTAKVPAAWVTTDEVDGSDYRFRRFCEEHRLNYVVAVSSTTHLAIGWKRQAVGKHLAEIPRCLATSLLRGWGQGRVRVRLGLLHLAAPRASNPRQRLAGTTPLGRVA